MLQNKPTLVNPASNPPSIVEYEPEPVIDIAAYEPFIGMEAVEHIKRLAGQVEGKTWSNVNSTAAGGGVAEMLRSAVPLARGLGVHAHWHVMHGDEDFFRVTKKLHNMLQGLEQPLTVEEIFGAYLGTLAEGSKHTYISSDLVVIHDPQPAALVMNGVIFGNTLWRCHVDTSNPHWMVWRFLLPYINQYAGAIFTMPEFVGPGLQIPLYQITPCIDPLAPKNHQYTEREALDILAPLLNEHNIDPERPILAAISRYDIHKNQSTILKAFRRLCKERNDNPPPYLIFLGNTAADDPESGDMLERLSREADGDPNVRLLVNVEDNDRVVGSLMRIARGFIQVSTKEGFGLVVSEALWQGTPVIGSTTGGITKQVLEARTGLLVDALDIDAIADKMGWLLDNPEAARKLGEHGREHVRNSFLLPELVRRYLMLLRYYARVSQDLPDFRLNGLSYSEIIQAARPRHPFLSNPSSSHSPL